MVKQKVSQEQPQKQETIAPVELPLQAAIVQAPVAALELAAPPSPEDALNRAERQIQIFKGYVKLIAKFTKPDDLLLFGDNLYLPAKICRDILSWARINMRPRPMIEHRYTAPEGEYLEFEVWATLSDSSGREVDVMGNRSTRDDFFGIAGKSYLCPLCKEKTERKKVNPNDKWDSNVCKQHGKVKAEVEIHYLPLYDVDVPSVRQAAVTNLYNHAVEAIGLKPTIVDLQEAGMDVSKIKKVDFRGEGKPQPQRGTAEAGGRPQQAQPSGKANPAQASAKTPQTPPAGATGQRTAGRASAASQPQTRGQGPQTHQSGTPSGLIKGVIEAVHIKAASGNYLLSSKGNRFVRIIVKGQAYQLFDNMQRDVDGKMTPMFSLLEVAQQGFPIEFVEEVTGGGYHNIKNILRIGSYEWLEDGTPVLRREAPPSAPTDTRTQEEWDNWKPNNPEVTDEDIPF